jgi:dipeptidyl-peptidase-4
MLSRHSTLLATAGLLLVTLGLRAGTRATHADPPPAPPAQTSLTLERVFEGRPIHGALPDWSWRPGHAELVRELRGGGRDDVVALDPATGVERVLLDLKALNALAPEEGAGEEGVGRGGPEQLVWKADGNALCVLVNGERVWVDLRSGARKRLTKGGRKRSDVQVSPDGRHVLYARAEGPVPQGHLRGAIDVYESPSIGLWIVPTDGSKEPQPFVLGGPPDAAILEGKLDWLYPEELGLDHAAWWSPDSNYVAYLTLDEREVPRHAVADSLDLVGRSEPMWYPRAGEKNPKASVYVMDVKQHMASDHRLDLGEPAPEYVVRVAWAPDAARVLVVTLDRAQRNLRLRSCDPTTGKGTTLFEEHDDAWIEPPPAPRFVGRHSFLWKRPDGSWVLHRLAPADPGLLVGTGVPLSGDLLCDRLVSPACDLLVGAGCDSVLVSALAAPGARRQVVWRVRGGSVPVPWLADAEDTSHAQADDTGTYALVRRSTTLRPPVLEVRRVADGALVRTLGDAKNAAYDALKLPEVEEGAIPTDGGSILWRLWKPRALEPGRKYPLVVTVYGGPGSRTMEDEFDRGPYFPALLVQMGFLVLQADGRGTGGQGPAFERKVQGRLGIHELDDVVTAVQAMAQRPYVDGARVGIFGWSFGGTMVVNAMTRAAGTFRAGVAVAPVTDWRLYDTIYTERYMGLPSDNLVGYKTTSAVENAQGFRGGLLLLHGLADDNVHPQNTLRLVEALLAAQKTGFDWRLYANRGHGLGGATRDVFGRVLEWFERTLQAR